MLLAAARRSCSRALALPGPPPVPVLPPWLPSVAPGSRGGGGRGVRFRGAPVSAAAPTSSGAARRAREAPARASPFFWAVHRWRPPAVAWVGSEEPTAELQSLRQL